MNLAIWKKAFSDAWLPLVVSSIILGLFGWLFVWLMSHLPVGGFAAILQWMPKFFQPMLGAPLADLATPVGQISILYVHMITMLICVGWAVGRGSDPITGEIGRGTMDLILSLPIHRATALVAPAVVATFGAALLAVAVWTGTWVGLHTVEFPGQVGAGRFLPGAVNLFCVTVCLTGITTLISSFNRDRWRVIAQAMGFFVISLILKMVGRIWTEGSWLMYGSFLSAFRPQKLILSADDPAVSAWPYNLTLLSIGLLCYLAAAVVFSRRDIPAAR